MSGVKWLCPAVLAFTTAPAQAITPEQAQTLPVAELARIVLGEAGAIMVDVDRPKWPTCFHCWPRTEDERKQPPPLHFGLSFYTRIFPERWNYEWRGLCGFHLITVAYDGSGKPSGIGKSFRWGAPHGMKRASTKPSFEDMEAFGEAERKKCATGTDPRTFFAFSDELGNGPYRVLVAAELFAEAAGRDSPLPFKFECKTEYGKCEDEGPKEVAERFQSANIATVEQVDCAEPHGKLSSFAPDACYAIQLKDAAESLFLELTGAFSEPRIKRIEYSRVTQNH